MLTVKEKEYPVQEAVRKAVGTTTNSSTIYKWWRDGVAGVRLEASFLGNKLYTSVEAVQRFRNAIEAKKAQRKNPSVLKARGFSNLKNKGGVL
jgi:hypothetical protein